MYKTPVEPSEFRETTASVFRSELSSRFRGQKKRHGSSWSPIHQTVQIRLCRRSQIAGAPFITWNLRCQEEQLIHNPTRRLPEAFYSQTSGWILPLGKPRRRSVAVILPLRGKPRFYQETEITWGLWLIPIPSKPPLGENELPYLIKT